MNEQQLNKEQCQISKPANEQQLNEEQCQISKPANEEQLNKEQYQTSKPANEQQLNKEQCQTSKPANEEQPSFIEIQFPVSKLSKESFKERKAGSGQTLTGLGKWWGRKPLVLVRALILGCLMPASDNPKKDSEIFLKLMSMDTEGLLLRKNKKFSLRNLYEIVKKHPNLARKYKGYFESEPKLKLYNKAPRAEIEEAAFNTLGYDKKIEMCMRPEQLNNLSAETWKEINEHLNTSANNLSELVSQLSIKRFGHNLRVGDCFCGGGSVPFEAARLGCEVYASDLNPIAGLLTWADLNICGITKEELKNVKTDTKNGDKIYPKIQRIQEFLKQAYDNVKAKIDLLGLETSEPGDKALFYLYCIEAECPESGCGYKVPLLPSLVISKAHKVIAKLTENTRERSFNIEVISGAGDVELEEAQNNGTVKSNALYCPHCGKSTPISVLRRDKTGEDGKTIYGLRLWEKNEFEARPSDVYKERLYAIRCEQTYILPSKKCIIRRIYRSPNERDIENENKVRNIVKNNFEQWQKDGLAPSLKIEGGIETERLFKERGWAYWHQLFNARQLLALSLLAKEIQNAPTQIEQVAGILGLNKCVNRCSKLCIWDISRDGTTQTFYNLAFNTLMNYGVRSMHTLQDVWLYQINPYLVSENNTVKLCNARDVNSVCDFWLTDPPYADAVNYHELSEFFLAWNKTLLLKAFSDDWYTDSKRVLAIRGGERFSKTMEEVYSNLASHMPSNGMQVVMFTHSDPAVWAMLALIMWKSGLMVTAAWNIATETEAVGLKEGNYIKGTVLMVLRKRLGTKKLFNNEVPIEIKREIERQIEAMKNLDNKEEPSFADPDYVLAAYAASLKVLTSCSSIGGINLDHELVKAISKPQESEVVKIINEAKKTAYEFIVPKQFEKGLWKELSNVEKFYIKGLESEKRGDYQISTYQEFARVFSIENYGQIMAIKKANKARLKTPDEILNRSIGDVGGFEDSILYKIFSSICSGTKKDEPQEAHKNLRAQFHGDYEGKREVIIQILSFLAGIKDIFNMQEHWQKSADMAESLLVLVKNERA